MTQWPMLKGCEELIERVARAIFDSHNRAYSVAKCKWESDPDHWRCYAQAAIIASGAARLRAALKCLYEAEKFHDPDNWRGEPAMIEAAQVLGEPPFGSTLASRDPEAAKLEEMREALKPFAKLQVTPPNRRLGNAGFYSLRFADIERAHAALGAANTPEQQGDGG